MKSLQSLKTRFVKKSQRGVTLIEYALIAALVAVASIVAMTALGTDIAAAFQNLVTKI